VTPWDLAVPAGNVLRLAWSMSFVRVAASRAGQRAAQRPFYGFRIGGWHRRILHFGLIVRPNRSFLVKNTETARYVRMKEKELRFFRR